MIYVLLHVLSKWPSLYIVNNDNQQNCDQWKCHIHLLEALLYSKQNYGDVYIGMNGGFDGLEC